LREPSHWISPPGPLSDGLRIGLLGGSFDPAHGGHLYVSRIALRQLKLDYVWWLVSPGNPLKPRPASLEARANRARLLAKGGRSFGGRIIVTDLESRLGTRFTIDTIAALQRRFPQVEFVWLMGSDNLEQFSRWRRWRAIAARLPIAVVRRPGTVLASLRAPLARLLGPSRHLGSAPSLVVLDGPRSAESYTRLRAGGAVQEAMLNLVS